MLRYWWCSGDVDVPWKVWCCGTDGAWKMWGSFTVTCTRVLCYYGTVGAGRFWVNWHTCFMLWNWWCSGDVDVDWTCAHVWCYGTDCAREMVSFLDLARMFNTTELKVLGRCWRSLTSYTCLIWPAKLLVLRRWWVSWCLRTCFTLQNMWCSGDVDFRWTHVWCFGCYGTDGFGRCWPSLDWHCLMLWAVGVRGMSTFLESAFMLEAAQSGGWRGLACNR